MKAALLFMLMCGCVETVQWTKSDAPTSSADQQAAACTLEAEKYRAESDESAEDRKARIQRWTALCMQASGFKKTN